MPRRGWWRRSRRRRTRPLARPMTGMRQRVTARSIDCSIRVAVLVMGARECGYDPSIAAFAWRSWSCAGRDPLAHAVGQGIAPVPLARLHELTRQHAAHDLLHPPRDRDQRVE